MRLRFVALIAVLLCGGAALDAMAASYKLETVSTVPEGLSANLQAVLQTGGYKVVNEQGVAWCEFGFARRSQTWGNLPPLMRSIRCYT
jgi:hypothetical protein